MTHDFTRGQEDMRAAAKKLCDEMAKVHFDHGFIGCSPTVWGRCHALSNSISALPLTPPPDSDPEVAYDPNVPDDPEGPTPTIIAGAKMLREMVGKRPPEPTPDLRDEALDEAGVERAAIAIGETPYGSSWRVKAEAAIRAYLVPASKEG